MLKLISALLSSLLVMESAVAVDEQNPAGDQLVKRGDAIQSIKGSDKIFTGEVKIVPLSESVPGMPVSSAYVIFEPGARSFWHTHPIGQVLIIVEGEGRSGVYGKPVSVLKKRRCGCMSERHQTFPWRSSRQENGSNDGYRVRSSRQERDMDGTGHGPAVQEQREVTTFPFLK